MNYQIKVILLTNNIDTGHFFLFYIDRKIINLYNRFVAKNNTNYNFTFKPQINSYSSNIISKSSGGFKQSNIGSKRNISSSNAGSKRRFNQNEVYDVEQEHQENNEEEGEEAIDNEN